MKMIETKKGINMNSKTLKRHSGIGIFLHWFNACCWFFLLVTGLGLISNPDLQPLGNWYPTMLREVAGSGENLLKVHFSVGIFWAVVMVALSLVYAFKITIPFFKHVASFDVKRDLEWLIKKNIQMLLGYRAMANLVRPLGLNNRIPDQGYYNAGQKVAALPMVLGGLLLVVTGLVMTVSKYWLTQEQVVLVQWSITIHYITAGLTLAVLFVHIFMAAVSRDERPSFVSMFTGEVPVDYARHHHMIWYENVNKK